MSTIFNRRAAFGVAGLGVLGTLVACTGSSENPAAPASGTEASAAPTEGGSSAPADYSGEVKKPEKYDTSAGKFEPATREHPPRNAPKPLKPDNYAEDSIAGLYANISYNLAAINYAVLSGDTKPVEESSLGDDAKEIYLQDFKDLNWGKDAWHDDYKITMKLLSPQPTRENDSYVWKAKITIDFGKYTMVSGQEGETPKNYQDLDATLSARYASGTWAIAGFVPDVFLHNEETEAEQ